MSDTRKASGLLLGALTHPLFWPCLGFGIALGCAVASKLNAAPVAFLLPLAVGMRWLNAPAEDRSRRGAEGMAFMVMAAVVSLLVFRLFQPYAFQGPSFFNFGLNPAWVEGIKNSAPKAAVWSISRLPCSGRGAPRCWFALGNIVKWGLGLPLGLLAVAGFLWAGWRMLADLRLKGEWQKHAVLWAWTAFYFAWQSPSFNPTMRYFLLIYPTLVIFAAWALVRLYDMGQQSGWRTPALARLPGSDRRRADFPGYLCLCFWLHQHLPASVYSR